MSYRSRSWPSDPPDLHPPRDEVRSSAQEKLQWRLINTLIKVKQGKKNLHYKRKTPKDVIRIVNNNNTTRIGRGPVTGKMIFIQPCLASMRSKSALCPSSMTKFFGPTVSSNQIGTVGKLTLSKNLQFLYHYFWYVLYKIGLLELALIFFPQAVLIWLTILIEIKRRNSVLLP